MIFLQPLVALLRLKGKEIKIKIMKAKKILLLVAALILAGGVAAVPVMAQENNAEAPAAGEELSLQSLESKINYIIAAQEEISESLKSQGEEMDELKASVKRMKKEPDGVAAARAVSEILKYWAIYLLVGILLPLLLTYIWLRTKKEERRRYDTVVDLVRSGVTLDDGIKEYLTGESRNPVSGSQSVRMGSRLGQASRQDMDYCVQRLFWGMLIIVVGLIVTIALNTAVFIVICSLIGLFLITQGLIRYFSIRYVTKSVADKEKDGAAGAGVSENGNQQ